MGMLDFPELKGSGLFVLLRAEIYHAEVARLECEHERFRQPVN